MKMTAQVQAEPTPTSSFTPVRTKLMQRKCACGDTPGLDGECAECRKKRLALKRRFADQAEPTVVPPMVGDEPLDVTTRTSIAPRFGHDFSEARVRTVAPRGIQTKLMMGQPGDQYEQEADQVAEQVMRRPGLLAPQTPAVSHIGPMIQRLLDEETSALALETIVPAAEVIATPTLAEAEPTTEPTTAEPTAETAGNAETTAAGLIVDDEQRELGPGQMRKSEFLDELRTSVCATADAELSRVGQSAQGCPYIESWIGYYRTRDSQHVERALRKYAPEAADVTSARDYILIVNERVRRGVATWATTGEITGVPEEMASQLPGVGLSEAVGGLVSGVAGTVSSAVSSVVSGVGGALSGIGGLFFKGRDGGAQQVDYPEAIQAQLGSGHSLDGGVKSRMESAFGHDFSRVRVHADARAAELSASLNARAFTIGSDVAFGAGEYQPGSLIGDALLAHELAHVVQQGGANPAAMPMQKGEAGQNPLEEDADLSAVSAVVSLWGGAKGIWGNISQNAMPRLRSGLRLQRCVGTTAQQRQTQPVTCTQPSANWSGDLKAAKEIADETERSSAMASLVQQALCSLNLQVNTAGNKHPNNVNPDDYKPSPVVNFDIELNQKQSWPLEQGAKTRKLEKNYGYNFRTGATLYIILGPYALDPNGPDYTRRAAEHERYLAERYTKGAAEVSQFDAEVDTWTQDFVKYFLLLGRKGQGPKSEPMYFGNGWQPLVDLYYEKASADAKKKALEKLVGFYKNPPVSGDKQKAAKELFELWIERRDQTKQLVIDLKKELGLGKPTSTPAVP